MKHYSHVGKTQVVLAYCLNFIRVGDLNSRDNKKAPHFPWASFFWVSNGHYQGQDIGQSSNSDRISVDLWMESSKVEMFPFHLLMWGPAESTSWHELGFSMIIGVTHLDLYLIFLSLPTMLHNHFQKQNKYVLWQKPACRTKDVQQHCNQQATLSTY